MSPPRRATSLTFRELRNMNSSLGIRQTVSTSGLRRLLVVAIISYAFYGMDAIGEEVQDPFGMDANDLPLAAIGRSLEIELRAMLGDRDLPEPLEPVGGLLS